MSKSKTGTREWADINRNIQTGCPNGCLYCYARADAVRFKRSTTETWSTVQWREYPPVRRFRGRVMFPSTHDITPDNLHRCELYLKLLLEAENQVLVVTKPRFSCVTRLCEALLPWRGQVLFRMTIGSWYRSRLKFWEPGAPDFGERLAALNFAHASGWQTSVSMEPMLDLEPHLVIERVRPFVTESIWLGLMRNHRQRLALNCPGDPAAIEAGIALARAWTDDNVLRLVAFYKRDPLVRWKDSITQVIEKNAAAAKVGREKREGGHGR